MNYDKSLNYIKIKIKLNKICFRSLWGYWDNVVKVERKFTENNEWSFQQIHLIPKVQGIMIDIAEKDLFAICKGKDWDNVTSNFAYFHLGINSV
jgi:hypothetical protein